MPPRPFKNGFHFFGSIRHARGIGRGIEHQRAASGGTDPFQIFRRDAKPPRRGRRSKYRHGSGQSRHVGVACPVGYGNNYFITGINDAHQHIEQRLLAAGADSDVFNCGLKPVYALEIPEHRFPQFQAAGNGRIMRTVLVQRPFRGVLDKLRRIKIRIPNHKIGNLHSL